jgi:hypothetical protein
MVEKKTMKSPDRANRRRLIGNPNFESHIESHIDSPINYDISNFYNKKCQDGIMRFKIYIANKKYGTPRMNYRFRFLGFPSEMCKLFPLARLPLT